MKKGKLRRFTAFLLAFAMIMTLMPTDVFAAGTRSDDKSTVTASADGITVTKHAEYVTNEDGSIKKDLNGNPYIKIQFDVTKVPTQVQCTTDIVLVIDNSKSMTLWGSQKLANAKAAAMNFVEKVLEKSGVKVGVVTFSKSAVNVSGLSNNARDLKNKIITELIGANAKRSPLFF